MRLADQPAPAVVLLAHAELRDRRAAIAEFMEDARHVEVIGLRAAIGAALVVMSERELPAWGSVKAMVPCHLPSNFLGTYVSISSREPKASIRCAAPAERNG